MAMLDVDSRRGPVPEAAPPEARGDAAGAGLDGAASGPKPRSRFADPITLQRSVSPGPRPLEGLAGVDRCIGAPDERGVLYIQGASEELAAVERHLARRARAAGRAVVGAGGLPAADAWREIARKLGIAGTLDPRAVAREIVARAGRSMLLVREGAPAQWGSLVAAALEHEAKAGGCLVLVLTERAPAPTEAATEAATEARTVELGPDLLASDVRLWLEAIVADPGEPSAPSLNGLRDLEGWWAAARATPAAARATAPELDADERRILDRLALSQRSWSDQEAAQLGCGEALLRLLVRRVLTVDAFGRIAAGPRYALLSPEQATSGDASAVAEVLETIAADDAWSLARASELHAQAGDPARAEQAMARALGLATDASVREDLWRRHEAVLSAAAPGEAAERSLCAAERALRLGDVDRALGFARRAATEQGDTFAAMWALGRAACAQGDLTTAAIALDKARDRAPDNATRFRIAVDQAEVRYLGGERGEARRLAGEGLQGEVDLLTRLTARNIIGKLYLAEGEWVEAERHFAEDAHDAACAGEVTAELRARVNRAIALLMMGRHDESKARLLAVVEDGVRKHEPVAIARGLDNLAVVAHRRQEYGEALQRYTEALACATRGGEKLMLARMVAGRAELAVCLNLLPEAEQAIAFGRRACGPGVPGAVVMSFEVVAARIHLAHRRTEEAAAAVRAAIKCRGSAHIGLIGECHLLAARIALEEGDLAHVKQALAYAREAPGTPRGHAETTLLSALLARAAGTSFLETALEALNLARQAEHFELVLEAHLLLARAHIDAGKPALARGNLAAAAEIRDRMARGLPQDVRARFLERPDFVELARLDAVVSALRESVVLPSGPRERILVEAAPARRILGDDPAIVALRAAIQRIGAVDGTVLILGENGTGKELVAEALHEASARRRGPLVRVNCAALAEGVLLSELFGHERGAFTGATARRQGRFEVAEGGTLFLDEIGDVSPSVQKALLRVLQERTFERVGGAVPLTADCRVVCATNCDLKTKVAHGEFREDLYYRLQGLVLQVPALRKRLGDLPLLASAMLRRIATERGEAPKQLSSQALDGLARHAWRGNVRELEHALSAATLFAEHDTLELDDFTRHAETLRYLAESDAHEDASAPPEERPRAEDEAAALASAQYAIVRAGVPLAEARRRMEHECITRALAETEGNITQAAERLGMKRSRLSQIVGQYGLRMTEEDES
jgi:DNA-binding NtrC family response regulator/tetratricopeptide (TPR) repeat protein